MQDPFSETGNRRGLLGRLVPVECEEPVESARDMLGSGASQDPKLILQIRGEVWD